MKKTKKFWILTGIILALNLAVYLTHLGGDTLLLYISDLLPALCALIASICLFLAVKKFKEFDFAKTAWLMIFIGVILYFLAEITYAILEISYHVDMNETFPTLADYFWCAGYIPILIGLMMMFIGFKQSGFPMGNKRLYGIVCLVILVIFSAVIYYLLMPIIYDTETSGIAKFFYLFYPVGDLFIVIPAFMLMYVTSLFGRGIISLPWKFLALGFILFTISDIVYSYLDWIGEYKSGNLIDLGWVSGYLLIGLSGLHQMELIESFNGDKR